MEIGEIKVGDTLKCVFNQPLPGNDYAPNLILGEEYECKSLYREGEHGIHVDVGLSLTLNFVRSYSSKQELPLTTHWCHPNRFIVTKKFKYDQGN